MGRVEACRICLITDVRMDRIDGSLETNFKSVFGHNVLLSADMPDYCCYECSSLIYKFSKFRKKYFTSQGLLFNILQNHGVVTEQEIKKIDRQASNLTSNLSKTLINNDQQYLEIKIESDPMADELEMTVDDEINNSGSDDDAPLHSLNQIEHINVNNMDKKQCHAAKRKNHMNTESGVTSNKMRKLQQNNTSNKLLKDFDVASLKSRADANGVVYLQADDFEDELLDADNTMEEYNPSSSEISIKILENQNVMIANQQTILSKLSDMSTGLQGITSNSAAYRLSIPKPSSGFFIKNKEQLDEFEKNLSDPEKRQMLWDKYTMLFSRKENGVTCAYILIDALFCRKFITQCSWSGGSRGSGSKIPLKIYTNIITFFHEIIHECDNNFSLMECHKFIKSVLKNAIKRSESKQERMSVQRNRRKLSDIDKTKALLHNMEAT